MENETKQTENRIGDLLVVLKRCWWLMLLVCVLATSSMFAYSKFTYQPQYTATISIWALKNIGTGTSVQSGDLSMAIYMVNDYKCQLTSDAVVHMVQQSKPLYKKRSIASLRSSVTVSHTEDTRILYLSARASTPEGAKELADTWGTEFCEYISGKFAEEVMVSYDAALEPTSPSNPISIAKSLLIGILGALLVYGIFFVKSIMDDRINSTEDVEKYLGLTVLGAIPNKNVVAPKGSNKYKYFKNNKYYNRRDISRKK